MIKSKYFTGKEIAATGAIIEDINIRLFQCLDKFRENVDAKICLLFNGLNTGKHVSSEHRDGKAVDFYFQDFTDTLPLPLIPLIKIAFLSGFSGIGVYYCLETRIYTFHFDLGSCRAWNAFKRKKADAWDYGKLINDPYRS